MSNSKYVTDETIREWERLLQEAKDLEKDASKAVEGKLIDEAFLAKVREQIKDLTNLLRLYK